MIGTLLILVPLILTITFFILHQLYGDWYNDGYAFLGIAVGVVSFLILLFAGISYLETSSRHIERESIQASLDRAREGGSQAELVMIQRDIVRFNRNLELEQEFYNYHFDLWVNDSVLEVEIIE